MKEIVEKKEVEELLGCEITDEQFEEALKYARHKQEYIYQRERRQVVLQHWYLVKLTEEYVRMDFVATEKWRGLTVTHLFLMYGTLRAATLLPTIFTLKGVKLKPEGVVTGIATALIIGLPVFAYGNITGTAAYKTAGSLLTVLLSGTVALIASRKRGAENG